MVFIPKPINRESTLIFGDGDEAVFGFLGNSEQEGFYLIHFRPTNKMKWRKQIQETNSDGYDKYDGWWKRIYKKDLCIQLSFDPDFPMWLVLCDYYGNESTPLMEHFVELKHAIFRIRDLTKQNINLRAERNVHIIMERRKVSYPEENFNQFIEKTTRIKKALGETQLIEVPPDKYSQQENP